MQYGGGRNNLNLNQRIQHKCEFFGNGPIHTAIIHNYTYQYIRSYNYVALDLLYKTKLNKKKILESSVAIFNVCISKFVARQ